jgi:hypothetical protein
MRPPDRGRKQAPLQKSGYVRIANIADIPKIAGIP